jgi:urea transport system substrate-binding protein
MMAANLLGVSNAVFAGPSYGIEPGRSIKIGLLWSQTGVMSVIEQSSLDAALFWVDETNRQGGIAGMEVVPVQVDARSDMKGYRDGASYLMNDAGVMAVFGGYTSASRRAVMPLIVNNNHLFYYPTFYEGRECWQNLICTGALANQTSSDLIPYMAKKYGPRAYFVGSNYVFPKVSNKSAAEWLRRVGGEVVAEEYMPLGRGDFGAILADIKQKQPDWIFSTVVGDSDLYFRQQYIKEGFTPDKMPTASLTTTEAEVKAMGFEFGEGHYSAMAYFQSLDNPTNNCFVKEFISSPYGGDGVTHASMEATYLSFKFFKKAVEKVIDESGVNALSPSRIRQASANLELSDKESPQGRIKIDGNNFNAWMTPRIGRYNALGQADIISESKSWIEPSPFVLYPGRGSCEIDGLHLPSGKIVESAS